MDKSHIKALRREFRQGRLTLYLGAGVSRESGLPSWSTLIALLYYAAVEEDWSPRWVAYPNYLYALGEWLLKKSGEQPEVIAGKLESYYGSSSAFHRRLREILYLPWQPTPGPLVTPAPAKLRKGNATLDAVAKLCEATQSGQGLHAVVTTNYDSLLEHALSAGPSKAKFKPIWKTAEQLKRNEKGIFHVHGYLPATGDGSPFDEIMLTEAQYHGAASDPYSWSNLTLIQCFSASTGLMIGMSLTDRNLRRLLHALHNTQLREEQYVLLKEPEAPLMTKCDVDEVQEKAAIYAQQFADSGLKKGDKPAREMQEILGELVRQEKQMMEKSLADMAVTPLWVRDYREVPVIVEAVAAS